MAKTQRRLRFFGEVMGLSPLGLRLQQAKVALLGEEDVPASRTDLSALAQFRPRYGPLLWAGRFPVARRALITNLYNHTQTDIHLGWSVAKRQVRDFRGRRLTYDSHNGTDFSIPVGTPVLTPAAGKVARVVSEYNRGGLKIFIDHGDGLMTSTAHLARPLVEEGQVLTRGQPIALSGYSGLDALLTFPWGTPHIHFNVWLNAEPIDPFPYEGHVSMWRAGDRPLPPTEETDTAFTPSPYSEEQVNQGILACKTPSSRTRLQTTGPLWRRAGALIAEMNYYPTRFSARHSPYPQTHERRPCLDLPFSADVIDGITFIDDL